jgi:hypothetical protein
MTNKTESLYCSVKPSNVTHQMRMPSQSQPMTPYNSYFVNKARWSFTVTLLFLQCTKSNTFVSALKYFHRRLFPSCSALFRGPPIPRTLSILFTLVSHLCLFWFILPDLFRSSVVLSHSWVCLYRLRFHFFPNIFSLNTVKCIAGFNRSSISHASRSHGLNCRKTFTQNMAAVA